MKSRREGDPTLALHGGLPAVEEVPAWPLADQQVWLALQAAFADGSWGAYQGPQTVTLVERLAELHQATHVLLCCSGTYAVEAALRGLAIGPGDEVLLAGYDFPGNFRAIETLGARPVLVDVQPRTWSLHPDDLAAAVSSRTRALIVSHLHGTLAPMADVMQWATAVGIAVVEDACQVPGARIDGQRAGTWGDVGVLSFGGSKLLTAGRGGALLTSRPEVYQRAKIHSQRGNDAFPLSELQAAVLIPQLEQLEQRNLQRRQAAATLAAELDQIGFLQPPQPTAAADEPAFYKLGVFLSPTLPPDVTRDTLIRALQAEGVPLAAGFAGFTRRSPRRCRHSGPLEHSRHAAEFTLVLHHPILLGDPPRLQQLKNAFRKVDTALRQRWLSEPGNATA